MSLQYEVRNAFSSTGGTFSVGTRLPAEEVAGWPTETLNNRVIHGDIVPVKAEAPVEEEQQPDTNKETTRKGK